MATQVECPRCGERSPAGKKCGNCGLMLDGGVVMAAVKSKPVVAKTQVKTERKCTVEGCNNKHSAKGLCSKHYMQDLKRRDKQRQQGEQVKLKSVVENIKAAALKPAPKSAPEPAPKSRKTKTDNSIHKISIQLFERDREVLDRLLESAEENRRSVSAEVLFHLGRIFQAVSR